MKVLKNIFLLSILSLVSFILIFINISHNGILVKLDLIINSLFLQPNNGFHIVLSRIIGSIFDTLPIIILCLLLAFFILIKYSRKDSLFFLVVMLSSGIFIRVVKELVQRARPVNSLISDNSFSFPSGTTTTAVVFCGLLIYLIFAKIKQSIVRKICIFSSVLIIILVGFSRVYLNVHWFSDVLGGLSIGTFILTFSIILKEILEKNINRSKIK